MPEDVLANTTPAATPEAPYARLLTTVAETLQTEGIISFHGIKRQGRCSDSLIAYFGTMPWFDRGILGIHMACKAKIFYRRLKTPDPFVHNDLSIRQAPSPYEKPPNRVSFLHRRASYCCSSDSVYHPWFGENLSSLSMASKQLLLSWGTGDASPHVRMHATS